MGSRAWAQQLWRTGPVALRHVGCSQTRDGTSVSALAGGYFTTELPGNVQKLGGIEHPTHINGQISSQKISMETLVLINMVNQLDFIII